MAVLVEAISVVMKADRLLETLGSFDRCKELVPNNTLAADGELVRVGFMTPDDVKEFIHNLAAFGMEYLRDGHAVDLVVIDQLRGVAAPCTWVQFGHVEISGQRVAAARLTGSSSQQIITPEGWTVEGSLSQTFGFVPIGAESASLSYLRTEDGVDVYWNSLIDREIYVGRTSKKPHD